MIKVSMINVELTSQEKENNWREKCIQLGFNRFYEDDLYLIGTDRELNFHDQNEIFDTLIPCFSMLNHYDDRDEFDTKFLMDQYGLWYVQMVKRTEDGAIVTLEGDDEDIQVISTEFEYNYIPETKINPFSIPTPKEEGLGKLYKYGIFLGTDGKVNVIEDSFIIKRITDKSIIVYPNKLNISRIKIDNLNEVNFRSERSNDKNFYTFYLKNEETDIDKIKNNLKNRVVSYVKEGSRLSETWDKKLELL